MRYKNATSLLARARQCIPNGVYGHFRSYAMTSTTSFGIPAEYPHFLDRAYGCRFVDTDGNEYIDYMCGYGPAIVGYGNERVDAAVVQEITRGISYSFPTPHYLELAETLVSRLACADWVVFALNGSDAIQLALVTARAHTGRSRVVATNGAYHGNQPWCSKGLGRVEADRSETTFIDCGDLDQLDEALRHEGVAAFVVCPYEQLVGLPNRMPDTDYWSEVRRICDQYGTLLLVDDVRSGFRLHQAGSCAYFNINADLVCYGKAMANGYPLACATGRAALMAAAERIFVSGTFWGFAPSFAAAEVTLAILSEADNMGHLATMGRQLTDGLTAAASANGFRLSISGPPALPIVLFEDDKEYAVARAFAQAMAHRGSFIHPTHNWFIGLAHTAEDIDLTIEHAQGALAKMIRRGI
jgi:glutamate-1-semialdehyde 2,1-aminomutase